MSQTLESIYNNISFALQLHTEAIARLQEQAATGSRINRASDEPSTAHQILELNSRQRTWQDFTDRLSEVISDLEFSSTIIKDIMSSVTSAKTTLSQVVSGIYGENERQIAADAINELLEHVVSLANTKHVGRYIFGGSDTGTQPYAVERTNGQITSVTYQGSYENRMVTVAPGVQSSSFNIGERLFRSDDRAEPIFTGTTGAAAGTGTSSVCGDVWLTVIHDGSNYKLSIDDGASYVTVPPGGDPNQAVTDSRTGKVLFVDSTGITSTGVELVRVPGTYDVFNTLISIRDILANERGLSQEQTDDALKHALDSLDELSDLLARVQVTVGSKVGYLENLKDNLEDISYNAKEQVSQLQDVDIAELAVDLSRRQALYQMSLSMAARILSVSLLEFIR